MTKGRAWFLAAVVVAGSITSSPPSACELAGPSTHIGKVKAIELAQGHFTIIDMQSKKDFTFQAEREQLQGLSLGQVVRVKYSEEDGHLKAELITPR
jgi:hypothetical protein